MALFDTLFSSYILEDNTDTNGTQPTQTNQNNQNDGDDDEYSMSDPDSEDSGEQQNTQDNNQNQDDTQNDDEDEYNMKDPDEDDSSDNQDDDTDEGNENQDDEDEYSMSDPDSEDGDNNTSDDQGDDGTNDSDEDDPDSKLKALEKSIFDNLSPEQQQSKIKELKGLYSNVYQKCQKIINMISGIEKIPSQAKVYDYIINNLTDLQKCIRDYLDTLFDSKTYIENMTELQKYIAILNTVNNVFDEMKKSSVKDEK